MGALYQGRALRTGEPRRHGGRLRRIARVLAVLAALAALAHVPWRELRHRFAVVTEVQVEGLRTLEAADVVRLAGLHVGQDLFSVNLAHARQELLLQPRIAGARVERRWPRGLRIRIEERVPVMLVRHGVPWEVDSAGVLLPPLERGVVADVPLLSGISYDRVPAGTQVDTPEMRRGLAWVEALSVRELQLGGQVSEVDVSDDRSTTLLLMSGTRVRSSAWPPSVRNLSALRVVLADLHHRGTIADEVDLRFPNQVIVRPASPASSGDDSGRRSS